MVQQMELQAQTMWVKLEVQVEVVHIEIMVVQQVLVEQEIHPLLLLHKVILEVALVLALQVMELVEVEVLVL